MAIDHTEHTIPVPPPSPGPVSERTVRTADHETFAPAPARPEMARRVIVLVFGLIQLVIGARIVLLLLDAREGNAIVAAILSVSQVLIAPFEGILRTDALNAAGSVLDITALVALAGWTILELIAIWVVRLFRRDPA
jgi:hypothetical protein